MLKAVRPILTLSLGLGAFLSTMHAADNPPSTVFVMTNDTVKNEVLAYERLFDGRLNLTQRLATGGRGRGGTTRPPEAQRSLTLKGDHPPLVAYNPGKGPNLNF